MKKHQLIAVSTDDGVMPSVVGSPFLPDLNENILICIPARQAGANPQFCHHIPAVINLVCRLLNPIVTEVVARICLSRCWWETIWHNLGPFRAPPFPPVHPVHLPTRISSLYRPTIDTDI